MSTEEAETEGSGEAKAETVVCAASKDLSGLVPWAELPPLRHRAGPAGVR